MIDVTASVMPKKTPEITPSEDTMFDVTSSVVPESLKSTITFRHEIYDEKATFSMQPEKIETKPSGAEYLFGQSKPLTEKKRLNDCNCELKVKQKEKEFEEIMKKATEVIERIEREGQRETDEVQSVEDTIKNVEEKLETELQKSVSRIDVRTLSQTVIDGIKDENRRFCQCEEKCEQRKNNFDGEDVGTKMNLPVTSMMKNLLSVKSQNELQDDDSQVSKEEVVNVESFGESPIIKRLKEIIFGTGSKDEEKPSEKFSKVQFKFPNPKTINRDSEFFKSCPCLENKEIYESKPVKEKILEFENLSAKSSAMSLKTVKSQTSLVVMSVEVINQIKEDDDDEKEYHPEPESSKVSQLTEETQSQLKNDPGDDNLKRAESSQAAQTSKSATSSHQSPSQLPSGNLESVASSQTAQTFVSATACNEPTAEKEHICCQLRKKSAEDDKSEASQGKERKCCQLRKEKLKNEELKLVAPPTDIEELPSNGRFNPSSKNKMETLSEEKELNKFYNRILMMDDEGQKKTPKPKVDDQADDDGFSKLVRKFWGRVELCHLKILF